MTWTNVSARGLLCKSRRSSQAYPAQNLNRFPPPPVHQFRSRPDPGRESFPLALQSPEVALDLDPVPEILRLTEEGSETDRLGRSDRLPGTISLITRGGTRTRGAWAENYTQPPIAAV